jgi:phage tail-like protein
MSRLIRPYDFILDSASGWRTLGAAATSTEDGSVQLQPLAQRRPALTDPHGSFGGLALPRGVAVWSDEIFIADPARHRILYWQPCCSSARPLATVGGLGVGPRQLDTPLGLAISRRDDLVVVDSGNCRLLQFTLPGLALRRIVGPFPSRLADAANGAEWQPIDVARGPHGRLHVADREGFVWRLDGQGRPDAYFPGALPAGFEPLRLLVDRHGRCYILGKNQPDILVMDAYGQILPGSAQETFEVAENLEGLGLEHLRLSLQGDQVLLSPADARDCQRRPQPTGLHVDENGRLKLDGEEIGPYLHYLPPVATFSNAGLFRVQRLDSGRQGNPWHRLTLEMTVPERTGIRVFTCTSDVLHADLPTAGLLEEPPQTGPWQAGPDNSDEFLIQSPPGRYLYLALALKGTGDRTPSVERIYVYARRHSSLHFLPAAYQAGETSRHVLDRLLSLTDTLFGEIESQVEDFGLLLDVAGAPADFLPWLASWFDLTLEQVWSEAQQRAFLHNIIKLYRWRGTIRGLRLLLQLHANLPEPMPQIVEHYRGIGQPALESWLGQSPEGDEPHHFSVLLPAQAIDTEEKRTIVMRLIESNKPAHTHFSLRSVAPGLRLGSTTIRGAALGLDSLLRSHVDWRLPGQAASPSDYVEGAAQDSVLARNTALPPAPAPRSVAVRLGYTRLGEPQLGCRTCHPCPPWNELSRRS